MTIDPADYAPEIPSDHDPLDDPRLEPRVGGYQSDPWRRREEQELAAVETPIGEEMGGD